MTRRPQAYRPEQVGWWEIVGLTAFVLFSFAAIVYALPVLLIGVLG